MSCREQVIQRSEVKTNLKAYQVLKVTGRVINPKAYLGIERGKVSLIDAYRHLQLT